MRITSTIGLIVISVAALLFADTVPDVQGLNYTVVPDSLGNPGGGVKLEWNEPYLEEGGGLFSCSPQKQYPDSYVIYADGVKIGTTTDDFCFVYDPCTEIEVRAVWDGVESSGMRLDFAAVVTSSLVLFSMDDPSPDHPSGFGFNEVGGAATAYSVSAGTNNDKIDFFVASGLKITSPNEHVPAINNERNTTSIEIGTYDGLKIVSPCGDELYSTSCELEANGIYGLWIDPTNNGYSADDNFAKAHVTGIDGYKVTFTFGFQTKAGLRWVVAD